VSVRLTEFARKPPVLGAAVWMVLACISYICVPEDHDLFWWLAYIFYLGAPTATTVFMFYLAGLYGTKSQEGRVWSLLGAGILLWCVGEWLWFLYIQVLEVDPFPSAADYMYIAGYTPLLVGLFLKTRQSAVEYSLRKAAPNLAVSVASAAIISTFIVLPILAADDYGATEKAISLTYPILDVALLVLAMSVVGAFWEMRESAFGWLLFSAGLIVTTAADILFSSLDWQGIYYAQIDLLWISAYLLILAGALYQFEYHRALAGE
jgi:hypothetical protein